ncbi:MAG: hypothetical protein MI975_02410 [Cytophagales bacterium]|nr:hypothetical protein [Cytophagales bacterium]
MATHQKIAFYKVRSFSQKLNATIEFIRQNYKTLGKSILYILGPMAVLNGLLFSQYIDFMFGSMTATDPVNVQNPFAFITNPSYIGFIVLSTFSGLLNVAVIFNFMKLYNSKYPEEITVMEILNSSWKNIVPLFLLGILITILIVVGFLVFIIPGIYLMIALALSVPALLFERLGIIESIRRSFGLIKGKWWSTFGLLFVASILMYAVSMIFILPFYVFYFISIFTLVEETGITTDLSSWWFQGGMALSVMFMFLGSFLTYSIPIVALSFQYFNLVERKESVGLMEEIEQLDSEDRDH